MVSINEYFETLAEKHLGHTPEECHFSNAAVFSAKVTRIMKYPCMGVDVDGWTVSGQNGNEFITVLYNMYFLSHVRDTHSLVELEKAFNENFLTAMRVLHDMRELASKNDPWTPARYFEFNGSEGARIEFQDAALYGYAVSVVFKIPFDYAFCLIEKGCSHI